MRLNIKVNIQNFERRQQFLTYDVVAICKFLVEKIAIYYTHAEKLE